VNRNFILKVEDSSASDIQKALVAAGIKVRSLIEVYKEEQPGGEKKEE
jgi:hypothetical protein